MNIPLSFQQKPRQRAAFLALRYFSFPSPKRFSELLWSRGRTGVAPVGLWDGTRRGGHVTSSYLAIRWWWWWWFWEEGGSAYPDWTAQVEKAPGSSFKRTQTSFRPSLMIDEEFRGWRFHARLGGGRRGEGTRAYQAWRMRRVNVGVRGGFRGEGRSI